MAISFTGSTYTQNFDGLAAVGTSWTNDLTLPSWYLFNKDKAAITAIVQSTGSGNSGSFYSFGSAIAPSDRALGGIGSGNAYFGSPVPASGAVAGLVAITPASGFAAPVTSIILGFVVSPICYLFVAKVKGMLGYDDSLDVFGVHGIGGIIGAVGTGILSAASFGGVKGDDYSIVGQTMIQIEAVIITILWTAIGSFILLKLVDMVVGLRVDADSERQGLDLTSHGESAYHG